MKRLQQVLARYSDSQIASLAPTEKKILTTERKEALLKDLESVQKTNQQVLWIAVILLVILFAVSIGVILAHPSEPRIVKAVSGALGVSAAGCVRWLFGIWREKTATEILLRLAVDLEGDALKAIVSILATQARSGKAR